jgi:glycosyltransferase involved in cell wall biosynthesis
MVSIVIAAYNAQKYLAVCLESVLWQSYGKVEAIVVDDASSDGTAAIAEAYATLDNRIRFVRLPVNQGASVARNTGIDQARGDWIAILDADDILPPEAMASLHATAAHGQVDLAAGNAIVFNSRSFSARRKKRFTDASGLSMPAHEPLWLPVNHWLFLYRRTMLDELGIRYPPGVLRGQDNVFLAQSLVGAGTVNTTRHVVYCYRRLERDALWSAKTYFSRLMQYSLVRDIYLGEGLDEQFAYYLDLGLFSFWRGHARNIHTVLTREELRNYVEAHCQALEGLELRFTHVRRQESREFLTRLLAGDRDYLLADLERRGLQPQACHRCGLGWRAARKAKSYLGPIPLWMRLIRRELNRRAARRKLPTCGRIFATF